MATCVGARSARAHRLPGARDLKASTLVYWAKRHLLRLVRVPMMESADVRERDDSPLVLDRARHGRIAAQGHMRAIVVVVADVLATAA